MQESTRTLPPREGSVRNAARRWSQASRCAAALLLDFFVLKPIAIFVWWFSHHANTIHFHERGELLRRIEGARAAGRPVIVASNHVSWFDDPVIPMALYRTGQRAALEYLALGGWLGACWLLTPHALPSSLAVVGGVAGALASASLGARKVWWTLGDQVNLSDASVLRGKFALTRKTAPSPFLGGLLRLADRAIPWFMRTRTTRTIFIDRRAGEDAKQSRGRALDQAIRIAERIEPVWVFFEGGRTRVPGTIAPARRGVGALVLGLRNRGYDPFVVVVSHSGMERLIPPGGSRFLSSGHRVEVCWSVFDAQCASDDQALANAIRETAVHVQPAQTRDRTTRPSS